MKPKVAGIVLLIGSLYYLIAEAISATFFNASLFKFPTATHHCFG